MANQGDYLQVKVKQLLGGTRSFENIWHYRSLVGTPDVENLVNIWQQYVITAWKAICPSVLTFETLVVENLFDPDDFIEHSLGSVAGTGDATVGAPLAGFVAMGVDIPNDKRSIRPSSKRLYVGGEGVVNGDLWDGTWLSGDVATAFSTMGAVLADAITPSSTTYSPITVKRISYIHPVSGKKLYRLPVSASEASHAYWTAFTPSTVVTSQVSRRGKVES